MIPISNTKSANSNVTINGYMPQLDALRAFAVFFVLIEHWLGAIRGDVIPFGMIGVTLFFVLSGFLITQILLKSRIDTEQKEGNLFHSIRQFYVRRTLRIFPIYYITIFTALIFNIENIRNMFLWFLFYASNIYFYNIHDWAGSISHLWTLAVEEQFYIFWPFLILFIPKKYLLKSIIAVLILAPLFRVYLYLLNGSAEWSLTFLYILTPSCMDCFGLGALFAYYKVIRKESQILNYKSAVIFLVANIASIIILLLFEDNIFSVLLFRFNVSVVCLFIIMKAASGFRGITGKILELPAVIYLGRISYGVYLYHNFIPTICRSIGIPVINNPIYNFVIQFGILILIASLSWFLIEKPVNNLKKYFKYSK